MKIKKALFNITGTGDEIHLGVAINIYTLQGFVKTIRLIESGFDYGSIDGFMKALAFVYSKRLKNQNNVYTPVFTLLRV